MKKKLFAAVLMSMMASTMFVGCGGNDGGSTAPTATGEAGNQEASNGDTPLVLTCQTLSSKFSPFFNESVPDRDVSDLTTLYLFGLNRNGSIVMNGIEGETTEYNGTEYTYYGPADMTIDKDDAANTTTYTIKLRDDLKFSDGTPVTIDDVIFTMYALCDNDFDGGATLNSQPIQGLKAYQANSTAADSVTDEMIQAKITEMPDALKEQVTELMNGLLTSEYDWVVSDVVPSPADYGLEDGITAEAAFAKLYGPEGYDATGKDKDTVISEVLASYGTDYAKLAKAYGDETFFDSDVTKAAQAVVIEELRAQGQGEEVPNISGIQRVDDYTLKVVTDGFSANMAEQLGVPIAPKHYYGLPDEYDYDNNKFGFVRGDLSPLREKTTQPMGAGPYIFNEYKNKVVYYTANPNYFLGEAKTKNLQFKETDETEMVTSVEQGVADISQPSLSKEKLDQIKKMEDKVDLVTYDCLGYGYLGLNADTIKVGDDSGSEQSKDLRKGLMTIFSVFRDVNIDSYYGDMASVINYPISNTSWAAPQKSDEDYEVAYSKDVDGNPIYTEDMDQAAKVEAAKKAALGFFEKAGYTVADGKVTAAPAGAQMSYEVIIPAAGGQDHPAFGLLTDAKNTFAEIGITLEINNPADTNVLWDSLNAGTQNAWTAAWGATADPDMYQVYHSSNVPGLPGSTGSNNYHITDEALDKLIVEARQSDDHDFRKLEYKQALDIILDWGIELPTYQRVEATVFSKERLKEESIPQDLTSFYKYLKEIQNIEVK